MTAGLAMVRESGFMDPPISVFRSREGLMEFMGPESHLNSSNVEMESRFTDREVATARCKTSTRVVWIGYSRGCSC
jgi:hypothetical protein